MNIPSHVITKYNKVWMLAQRGEPNEAHNAQRVLTNMERQHQGIKEEARKTREKEKKHEEEIYENGEDDPTRHWSDVYHEKEQKKKDRQDRQEKWEKWKTKASSFFNWAAHSAHEAFSIQQLQEWAYDVEIRLRENKSGSVSAAIKIPQNIVWKVDQLPPQHRLIFSRLVGQMVEQEMYEYLGEVQ